MNRIENQQPTDAELEILQVLWNHGPSSVRFVNEELNKNRSIGYTTTLKFMQLMSEKSMLSRNTESRSHIYASELKESKTKTSLLKSFVANTFEGSAMSLVMSALGNKETTAEELAEVKAFILEMEKQKL